MNKSAFIRLADSGRLEAYIDGTLIEPMAFPGDPEAHVLLQQIALAFGIQELRPAVPRHTEPLHTHRSQGQRTRWLALIKAWAKEQWNGPPPSFGGDADYCKDARALWDAYVETTGHSPLADE